MNQRVALGRLGGTVGRDSGSVSRSSIERFSVAMRASLRRGFFLQCCQEALMDVVKTTVRHNQNHVRSLRVAAEMVHYLCGGRVKPGANPLRSQRFDQYLG
jgi:hypothetical protein